MVTNGGLDGSASNGTTDFYWSGWQTIEEHDGADALTQQYVYGIALNDLWTLDNRRAGITVAQLNDATSDQRKFYYTDVLGSVYALSNEAGQILDGFQYDAYGVPTEFGQDLGGAVTFGSNVVTVGTTVPANPYLYASYRFDGETFQFYVNNRYYGPDDGRFRSRDPLAYLDGFGLYEYVQSRPTMLVDPSGLRCTLGEAATCALKIGWWDCWTVYNLAQESFKVAGASGLPGPHNGPQDAFRHCYWSCRITQEIGSDQAEIATNIHEECDSRDPNPPDEKAMDEHNNTEGRECGTREEVDCNACCREKVDKKVLQLQLGGEPKGSPYYGYCPPGKSYIPGY